MSDESPTLKDIWRLLGAMNKRLDTTNKRTSERFDALERELVRTRESLEARMAAGFGALKASIEARDFRLDEHGRRLQALEERNGHD